MYYNILATNVLHSRVLRMGTKKPARLGTCGQTSLCQMELSRAPKIAITLFMLSESAVPTRHTNLRTPRLIVQMLNF